MGEKMSRFVKKVSKFRRAIRHFRRAGPGSSPIGFQPDACAARADLSSTFLFFVHISSSPSSFLFPLLSPFLLPPSSSLCDSTLPPTFLLLSPFRLFPFGSLPSNTFLSYLFSFRHSSFPFFSSLSFPFSPLFLFCLCMLSPSILFNFIRFSSYFSSSFI